MNSVVVDASAMVEILTAPAPSPDLRRRLRTCKLNAPELIIIEILNVLRRRERMGLSTPEQRPRPRRGSRALRLA